MPSIPNSLFALAARLFPLAACTAGGSKEAPALGMDCRPHREAEWEDMLGPGFGCKPHSGNEEEASPRTTSLDCKPRRENQWEARVRTEDAMWDAQLKNSGSIGRIVKYEAHEQPCYDVILRGGSGQRMRVQAVCQSGKAALAGVRCGDLLVSVNGTKDFASLPLEQFYQSLPKPAVLVFIGLVNHNFTAELRIKRKERPCGLPSKWLQFPADDTKESPRVVDEVVFETATAFD